MLVWVCVCVCVFVIAVAVAAVEQPLLKPTILSFIQVNTFTQYINICICTG